MKKSTTEGMSKYRITTAGKRKGRTRKELVEGEVCYGVIGIRQEPRPLTKQMNTVLDHLPTGLAIGMVRNVKSARSAVRELMQLSNWQFTKDDPVLKQVAAAALEIIKKYR